MYTNIKCVKKCLFQENGKCTRNSVINRNINRIGDKECVFFVYKQSEKCGLHQKYWSQISNSYF